jgi:hypothetical protein
MAGFDTMLPALKAGRAIRRNKWDAATKMFIDGSGALVQQATGAPYAYSLNGAELTAKDWQLVGLQAH